MHRSKQKENETCKLQPKQKQEFSVTPNTIQVHEMVGHLVLGGYSGFNLALNPISSKMCSKNLVGHTVVDGET